VVRNGRVAHRRGVTGVPGLYFVGLTWQHTRGSALLGFVNDDAAYLAGHIARTAAPARPSPTLRPSGLGEPAAELSPATAQTSQDGKRNRHTKESVHVERT
jgi:putative flavoprotein involved in K+ transport